MTSIVIPVTSLRLLTSTDMLGLGLASLPADTTDVTILGDTSLSFGDMIFDSSVAYTYNGRTTTFYGTGLLALTAATGGPLHYTLAGGQLGAIAITDSDGSPLRVSMTGLDLDVEATLFNRFFGPETDFMAALLSGADHVIGSGGRDTLVGFGGNDQLEGGNGADLLRGLTGNDTLWGGNGIDRIIGGVGNDLIQGGVGRDILHGNGGADVIYGGTQGDRIFGHIGNDRLIGAQGHDTMFGGDGADRLRGGQGFDRLSGGDGADTFLYRNHDGTDVITDFVSGEDKIWIELRDSDPQNVSVQFTQVGGNTRVQFLDVTLTFVGLAPGDLDFSSGGDFLLMSI